MKGDILACWGNTYVDKSITSITGSKISHLAIVRNDTEIIESLAKGLKISPLSSKKDQYLILRYKYMTDDIAKSVISFLESKLGTKFDFLQLLEIYIYKRFRVKIHLCDPHKYVCVESVNHAFLSAGINLFPKVSIDDIDYIEPGMILESPGIKIVGGRLS